MAAQAYPARPYIGTAHSYVGVGSSKSEGVVPLIDNSSHPTASARPQTAAGGLHLSENGGSSQVGSFPSSRSKFRFRNRLARGDVRSLKSRNGNTPRETRLLAKRKKKVLFPYVSLTRWDTFRLCFLSSIPSSWRFYMYESFDSLIAIFPHGQGL